jgi:hypothetical protein
MYYSKPAGSNVITIRRDFRYFLSIDSIRITDSIPNRISILIGVDDIIGFRMLLTGALEWYHNPNYAGLYISKDGSIRITKQVEPIRYVLANGKDFIMLEPMVYVSHFNDEEPGIRMYLSSEDTYIGIPITRFRGLVYVVNTIDMYSLACIMVNYLQRPEYGTNVTNYSQYSTDESNESLERTAPKPPSHGRKIGDSKKKPTLDDL